ncbi:MAG TPA: pyridoxamine 5'-phosphate oxidase family protein [Saprospiraceae bacterium]|nr:pyridoxamine 5'-phosphate oxidase family protein [Saprospiraceae bacterium]
MGKFYDSILPAHTVFIEKQHLFFVATSPLSENGHINLSPKGLDSFRVLGDNKVAYLDLISSGNETSAHLLENGRITFMFCSFEGAPNILRLYGKGHAVLVNSEEWNQYSSHFTIYESTRQIMVADIDLVQTSCGFGIPLYDFVGERSIYFEWAEKKREIGFEEYIQEKNLKSIDGLITHLGMEETSI